MPENQKLKIVPKAPKGEDGYKIFSVRIKEPIVSELDAICARTGCTRNELVSLFLQYTLEHYEISEE